MSTSIAGVVSDARGPGLRLALLGRFGLEQDGRPVRLRTRKEEALLAYLVLHPNLHTREHLAELFWGDTPELQARASLRSALAGLRTVLGPDMLLTDRVMVQLSPSAAIWVDALEFQAQAAAFLSQEHPDPVAFNPCMYQGELLAGHYDDWVLDERERLRRLYIDALLHRVGCLRALARYEEAIAAAHQTLAADGAEERAHQHLIFLYAVAGNRPAALRQLDLCRRRLKEDLDVEPSAETLALVDAIASGPGDDAAPTGFGNLPKPLTSFVGREPEIAALGRLFGYGASEEGASAEGGSRLVTLTGAGGSGKTRLAIQVARSQAPNHCDGAWWVDLSSLTDPSLVPDTALSALGVVAAPGQPSLQALIGYLRGRNLLLVLDNCEHVSAACARMAAAVLQASPRVKILATSREPLGVPGEQLWPIPAFAVPATVADGDVQCLLRYDAIRLFVERARMQRPSFALAEHNAGQVSEICRRLDGMPLAIELAAARVRSMEVKDVLDRLENRLRLLASGSALVAPRQQTLRASIDWSYNLLSLAERRLLQRLSVFVGGCTLGAAEAVCASAELPGADIVDVLGRLVDRSLVVAEEGRYRLLETIREYALEELAGSGDADALRDRHAGYFAGYLADRHELIVSSEQHRAILEITAEIGNVRAAWEWAVAARRYDLLRRSTRSLIWYCEMHNQFCEGEVMYARAVQVLADDAAADPGFLAMLRAQHGYFLGRLGKLAAARSELDLGCGQLRQLGSQEDLGQGLTLLGTVVWQEGDYPLARALLEESLGLNRMAGDQQVTGLCLFFLGLVEQSTGKSARADAYFREAVALGRSNNQPRLISMTSVFSAPALLAEGQYVEARTRLQEGLALARATQDRWLVGAALGHLGMVMCAQGDHAAARTALSEGMALAQETGNRWDLAWLEVSLGDVYLAAADVAHADAAQTDVAHGAAAQADVAAADAHYRTGLQLALEADAMPIALDALAGCARLRARAGDRERALELAGQVALHPASSGSARARAAEVRRLLEPDAQGLSAAVGARNFEDLVHGILVGN